MPERPREPLRSGSLRTAVVWDSLRQVLADRSAVAGAGRLDVLDAGGGTGGFAVPVACLGHRVTVVDPSPDALAALERRAREAGVTERVRGVQGDAADVLEVLEDGGGGPAGVDVVLCHGVLERVDDPAAVVTVLARALRDGGTLSLLVAQRTAVVLARALAGRFDDARRALADPDGRWGDADPLPRRFAHDDLLALVTGAGLTVHDSHGARVFTDLLPGALVDLEPGAAQALAELESVASRHPALGAVAAQLHVLAGREQGHDDRP